MQIHRNYKFRLYPNKAQIDLFNLHFFLSNQAWNSTLAQKMTDLKANAHLLPADRAFKKDADLNAADNLLDYHQWSLEQTTLISSRKSESLSIPA